MIFTIKCFRTIVFIFIVISRTFRPISPPAFFMCLSNLGTYTELRTTSFIESTGVACSDSVNYNRVQGLSIPVLLLTYSQDWTWNFQMIVSLEALGTNSYNRYAMCPAEEGRRTYRLKRCRNNNKDEDNSPKTLMIELICLHTSITIVFTQLNGFNNCYAITIILFNIIICLPTVKLLQVFLFNTNYSIQHDSLICTQLNSSKYWYLSQSIQCERYFKKKTG